MRIDVAILIGGDIPLQLNRNEAGIGAGAVRMNDGANCFSRHGGSAQAVIVDVGTPVTTGIGEVVFPVVGSPSIAAGAVEGQVARRTGNALIFVDAIDPR